MWRESGEQQRALRSGLSTGTCATACALAAAEYLLSQNRAQAIELNIEQAIMQTIEQTKAAQKQATQVSVTLPKGKIVELAVTIELAAAAVMASTIKDAGDDPDVTHGARVFVELSLTKEKTITFAAAKGVGTVTRDGLALPVGEPAINPVPRKMMREHLLHCAQQHNYSGGFHVAVGVENGELIAKKTMNPRLGIIGGLSILGTTGIVRPFSCGAWIASIYQGIDVAQANGLVHIAATTGNSSEQLVQRKYAMQDMAIIEMGDFAGAVFKHLKKVPIERVSICGGFGKITKLANGHLDLNSRVSSIDFPYLAALAQTLGADKRLQETICAANTS
nr:cobalt-precorrin-5B (C(1))-methyltransferase [Cellvibrionaceae bacterium]